MWRLAKSLLVLVDEINRSAPGRDESKDMSDGGAAYANRPSDHKPCPCHRVVCALDFTHDPSKFDAHVFAEWLAKRLKSGAEGRVKYIISDGRICSGPQQPYRPGVWREYRGIDRHSTHIHVAVSHPSGLFDYQAPWDWEVYAQENG